MKYLSIYPEWNCRKAGGLFLGIRVDFPVAIYDSESDDASRHTYTLLRFTIGLIVCSIKVDIKYYYRKTLYGK